MRDIASRRSRRIWRNSLRIKASMRFPKKLFLFMA
jgi:hypothetical protein